MYKEGEKIHIIKVIDDKRYFDKYEVVSVEKAKDHGCWLTGINQLGNQTTRWYNKERQEKEEKKQTAMKKKETATSKIKR